MAKTAKKAKPHAVIDANLQAMVCNHCGSKAPIPLGKIQYVCDVMKAWGKAHRTCKPGSDLATWQSRPKVRATTQDA